MGKLPPPKTQPHHFHSQVLSFDRCRHPVKDEQWRTFETMLQINFISLFSHCELEWMNCGDAARCQLIPSAGRQEVFSS